MKFRSEAETNIVAFNVRIPSHSQSYTHDYTLVGGTFPHALWKVFNDKRQNIAN